jgi:transcriptional regulator with XRE-family HTH domain
MQSHLSSSTQVTTGARIRHLRKQNKWTQARLALQLELEAPEKNYKPPKTTSFKSNISRWEKDLQIPNEAHRRLLAAALKVEVSDLGLTEDPDFVW